MVFLALRGEEQVECFWPMPLELLPTEATGTAVQLRLIVDDGYAGPGDTASRPTAQPAARPRRRATGTAPRPQTSLL